MNPALGLADQSFAAAGSRLRGAGAACLMGGLTPEAGWCLKRFARAPVLRARVGRAARLNGVARAASIFQKRVDRRSQKLSPPMVFSWIRSRVK
jgi:hypothetical protein